jgi:hypothetical protein
MFTQHRMRPFPRWLLLCGSMLLAAVPSASVGGAGTLDGAETQILPASNCVAVDGIDALVSSRGNIYNKSYVTALHVVCPVQFDFHKYSRPVAFVLTMTDRSADFDFACYVGILGYDGKTLGKGPEEESNGVRDTYSAMTLNPPADVDGAWNIHCWIPPRQVSRSSSVFSSIAVYQYLDLD